MDLPQHVIAGEKTERATLGASAGLGHEDGEFLGKVALAVRGFRQECRHQYTTLGGVVERAPGVQDLDSFLRDAGGAEPAREEIELPAPYARCNPALRSSAPGKRPVSVST